MRGLGLALCGSILLSSLPRVAAANGDPPRRTALSSLEESHLNEREAAAPAAAQFEGGAAIWLPVLVAITYATGAFVALMLFLIVLMGGRC